MIDGSTISKEFIYLQQNPNTIYISWALRTDGGEQKAQDSGYDVKFWLSYFCKGKELIAISHLTLRSRDHRLMISCFQCFPQTFQIELQN